MSFTNESTCSHCSPRGYFNELPCGRVSLSMFQMENTIGYISRCFKIWLFSHSCYFFVLVVSSGSSVQLFGGEPTKPRERHQRRLGFRASRSHHRLGHMSCIFSGTVFVSSLFLVQAPQNTLPDSMRDGDSNVVLCNPQLCKAVLIELPWRFL